MKGFTLALGLDAHNSFQGQLVNGSSNNYSGKAMGSTFTLKQGSSVITDWDVILRAMSEYI